MKEQIMGTVSGIKNIINLYSNCHLMKAAGVFFCSKQHKENYQ